MRNGIQHAFLRKQASVAQSNCTLSTLLRQWNSRSSSISAQASSVARAKHSWQRQSVRPERTHTDLNYQAKSSQIRIELTPVWAKAEAALNARD
jgi:hypothetical protein